jgi:hypothetical protein
MRSPKHLQLLHGVLIASLSSCGYTSRYSPPFDGRARPLWEEDHITNNLTQLDVSPACRDELYWTAHPDEQHPAKPIGRSNYWVPVYYGSDIVVPATGTAPLQRPSVTFEPTAASPPSPPVVTTTNAPGPEALEEVLRFPLLIVLVLLVPLWPPIAVALATSPAESGRLTFDAIDEANAYNDLSRSTGTRCSFGER